LRAQPLVAQHELATRAGCDYAVCVGVATPTRIAFGRDQHMLAERGQMMSTERTAIRRRLQIRRTAHRPPWSLRKAGHAPIVAPLAATLAATLAVGVGVALARAERERRAVNGRRRRDRRFALLDGERLGVGLQRMALGQLELAIEALAGEDSKHSPEQRVHEARKALKRLRALLRLVREDLGEQTYERESALLRDAGARLARARDAEILLATLDGMIAAHAKRLGGRRGVQRLRTRLRRERDGAAELALADSATHAGVVDDLRALRVRVSTWELADPGGIEAIEPALERLYGKGRRRMRRAKRTRGERARGRRLHEWRKRVKDLRYAAEMLEREEVGGKGASAKKSGASAKRSARKHKARGQGRYIRKLARRADELGELLGEEHDLAVLAERVREEAKATRASGAPGPGTRKLLLKLISKRRKKLRKRALRDGERLYDRSPKRFVRRVHSAAALGFLSRR
jgi:CHAD domain-containing protein